MQRNGTQRHAGEETGQNSNATKPADRAGRHMRWHGQMCDLDQPNSTLRTPLLVLHPVPFFLAGRWTLDHPGISPIPLPPGGSSSSRRVGLWVKAWRAYVVHHALRAFPYGCSTTTTHGDGDRKALAALLPLRLAASAADRSATTTTHNVRAEREEGS